MRPPLLSGSALELLSQLKVPIQNIQTTGALPSYGVTAQSFFSSS
jgi:hypothetical protein